jgi:hypothetical protein
MRQGRLGLQPKPDATTARRRTMAIVHELTRDRVNQIVFVVVAGLVGLAYSVLLPFAFTQRISWRNWRYLDTRYIIFSVAFGLAIAWIVAVQSYAMRRIVEQRGTTLGGAGAVLGVMPSFLCCTPIVPTLLGFAGLSGASLARTSGRTQYFFATKQNLILAGSLGLIVIAGLWATRRVVRATCFDQDGCVVPDSSISVASAPDGLTDADRPRPSRETAGTRHD